MFFVPECHQKGVKSSTAEKEFFLQFPRSPLRGKQAKERSSRSLKELFKFRLEDLRVCSFGVIWIGISDPRSLGSWCIKGTDESTLDMDSSVPLMHHDPDRSWITDPDPDHPKGTHP